jgi:predicted phosphoribosyltransferase
MFFKDRVDAGIKLAELFAARGDYFRGWDSVMGIARGGVTVGAEVARVLNLPFGALCVDDLGFSEGDEFPGTLAVATTSFCNVYSETSGLYGPATTVDVANIGTPRFVDFLSELREKELRYNDGRDPFLLKVRKVIVCDDGLVSGRSLQAIVDTLRQKGAEQVAVGIPVVPGWFGNSEHDFELVTWRVLKMKNPKTGVFYFSFEDSADADVVKAVRESALSS